MTFSARTHKGGASVDSDLVYALGGENALFDDCVCCYAEFVFNTYS